MLDHVLIWINGRRHEIRGREAFLSLSDYLRRTRGLVGTKIVCSEGDCGACTVLVGRVAADGSRLVYQPVDSCIQFLFQLDGTHVVTVEGLGGEADPSPVQQSMIEHHGSQCGYCTPGFVVAMTGLLEERELLDDVSMRCGLTGNLCRCTGYSPILEAGRLIDVSQHERIERRFPSDAMICEIDQRRDESIEVTASWDGEQHTFISPPNLESALKVLDANPNATLVAGATDIGVQINKSMSIPPVLIDLNRVEELAAAHIENDELVFGARTNWTTIADICRDAIPEFYKIINVFGAPQIRHVGTIGGNIANASPIADSLPFLHVMETTLELRSTRGTREMNINDFYKGYKKFDLRSGELITRVRVPLPGEDELLKLYKVSRRRDLDIASFTAAIRLQLDGEAISRAAIAFGAVGPTVIRARKTEAFLQGREFNERTMRDAGKIAVSEVAPISDVRGSAEYRYRLTRNILMKFWHETATTTALAGG